MSKNNFKLSLNKQVVSKLNAEKIVAGEVPIANISEDPGCPYSDWICFKTDHCHSSDYKCPWSGPNTQ